MTAIETIRFNSGATYTTNGQRITATLHDDGVVTFFDHDRMIDGEFSLDGNTFCQAEILFRYRNNLTTNTYRSKSDAMSVEGCNSKP